MLRAALLRDVIAQGRGSWRLPAETVWCGLARDRLQRRRMHEGALVGLLSAVLLPGLRARERGLERNSTCPRIHIGLAVTSVVVLVQVCMHVTPCRVRGGLDVDPSTPGDFLCTAYHGIASPATQRLRA